MPQRIQSIEVLFSTPPVSAEVTHRPHHRSLSLSLLMILSYCSMFSVLLQKICVPILLEFWPHLLEPLIKIFMKRLLLLNSFSRGIKLYIWPRYNYVIEVFASVYISLLTTLWGFSWRISATMGTSIGDNFFCLNSWLYFDSISNSLMLLILINKL